MKGWITDLNFRRKPKRLASFLVVLGFLNLGCEGVQSDYCRKAGECDNDMVVGEAADSVDVCIQTKTTDLERLRVNSEEICHDLASAKEKYMLCVLETEGCEGFNAPGPACLSEGQEVLELATSAEGACDE